MPAAEIAKVAELSRTLELAWLLAKICAIKILVIELTSMVAPDANPQGCTEIAPESAPHAST